jgi:hypothetical protein
MSHLFPMKMVLGNSPWLGHKPSNLLMATFQASIMDGFAVRSSDGLGTFPVDAEQFAGDDVGPLQPGGIQWLSNGFRREMPGTFRIMPQKPSINHVFLWEFHL